LRRHLPELEPAGASAGLHLLAWLPPGLDEGGIVDAAERAGIGLAGVSGRRIAAGPGGLIFGYGGIAAAAIDAGIQRLAQVIAGEALRPPATAERGRLPG
jgi:GntR family transcriptional regulator/MocR family aminotransferase